MANFGKKSQAVIATISIPLQLVLNKAIKTFDFSANSGHRTKEEQAEKVKAGLSKTMASKHIFYPSKAVDISPYPIYWGNITKDDFERFCYLAGHIMSIANEMGIKLRWGRDWDGDTDLSDQEFNDYGHFEEID